MFSYVECQEYHIQNKKMERDINVEKNEQQEYIRTFSIIAVLIIHTAYMGILQFENMISISQIVLYRCVMNLMWWAVPCFLILSGSLLLEEERHIRMEKLFKKYILRMLIVLFTFGLIFAWMELFFYSHKILDIEQICKAVVNVLKGNSWAHMWYVYCLIGLYLLLPLWKLVAEHASDEQLKYILLVMLVCNAGFQMTKIFGLELGFYNHISTIYPFWFLMGAAWNRGMLKFSQGVSVVMTVIASILLILTSILKEVYGMPFDVLFGYDSLLVIIQAIGIYIIIMNRTLKSAVRKISLEIANKSFGIYLIHMFFLNIAYKLIKINPFIQNLSLFILFLLVILNLMFSYIITSILKKLPLFRSII